MGCPGTVTKGKGCSVCGRGSTHGWGSGKSSAQRGYGADWRKVRARKLRHNPLCEQCLQQGYDTVATRVHHLAPFKGINDPARLDVNNLESLCKACHDEATGRR